MKINLASALQILILILSFMLDWYAALSIALLAVVIVSMLDKLGKGIVLREIIALHITFVCLIMPVIGYTWFTKANHLARIFRKYMLVPEPVYFSFALPAVAAFVIALSWPIDKPSYSDNGKFLQDTFARARVILDKRPKLGLYMLIGGSIMFFVSNFLPSVVRFAFSLCFFASFAGFLYVNYTKSLKSRKLLLIIFAAFIFANSLTSGMFTIVAYMSMTLFSFFFMGQKTALWKKFMWFVTGLMVLLLIQSVKPTFRKMTWGGNYEGNKAVLFANLFIDKLGDFNSEAIDAYFLIYMRANQGFNIGLVMRRIPVMQPFDGGINIATNLASSLIPRIFWPDKPEAGGKYNMQYYAGITLKGWSTNVGPLGEAYGSFGVAGGIIFMFFLGLFIRYCYAKVFKLAINTPLLIFWIPVMFYQVTYAAETDCLQIFNSVIKSAFFVFLLYKYAPVLFGMAKKKFVVGGRQPVEYTSVEPSLNN